MKWILLKEQRPQVDYPVLIFADNEIGIASLNKDGIWLEAQNWTLVAGDWGHYENDREIQEHLITHWMQIPDRPGISDESFQIWMEGYAATGERSGAQLLGYGYGHNFDEAVEDLRRKKPDLGINKYERSQFDSEEDYINRRSNWNVWACRLFDNETDARKSFG
jgi:hypothetical protein